MTDVLGELTEAGVSVWLDDISRERLRTGNLAALVRDFHVRGVTSNPTIFANALAKGDAYDEQIKDLAVRGVTVDEASRMITTYDIRWARRRAPPASTTPPTASTGGCRSRSTRGSRGRPSKTVAEAKQLWWLVDRPNMFIKIPATAEGVPAITATLAEGISRQRDADLLARAVRRGHRRLHGRPRAGRGERARHLDDRVGGVVLRVPGGHRGRQAAERDRHPRGAGAEGQGGDRQRAARLRAVRAEAGHRPRGARWPPRAPRCSGRCGRRPPPRTRRCPTPVRGRPGRRRHGEHHAGGDAARHRRPRRAAAATRCTAPTTSRGRCSPTLEALGISYDDVVQVLEDEGVSKFEVSWSEMLATIKNELSLNS